MDVIIFGGQSNMQGQTEGLPENNESVQGAWEYRFLDDTLIPLKHPVGEDVKFEKWIAAAHMGGGSLVPDFCRAYIEATGREVVAIHTAKGSTTLAEWLHGTQHHYWAFKKQKKALEKISKTNTIDRIYYVWLQGESDAIIETAEEEYYNKLITYKNELKNELGIDLFGIIKVGYFTKNTILDEGIMRAQERAVETDSDFVMLSRICVELSKKPEYLNPNARGHYNNEGLRLIGEDAGHKLADLTK